MPASSWRLARPRPATRGTATASGSRRPYAGSVLNNTVFQNTQSGILLVQNVETNFTVNGNIVLRQWRRHRWRARPGAITDNLIYNNVGTGIAITGGATISVDNNTVYQPAGQALTLSGGVWDVTVENNILWVNAGDIINVASGSAVGFVSGYNLFYLGNDPTSATLGVWKGTSEATLAAWQTASGQDANSAVAAAEPAIRFVNMDGPDGILGGPGTALSAGRMMISS